jgi:hypothetical protein
MIPIKSMTVIRQEFIPEPSASAWGVSTYKSSDIGVRVVNTGEQVDGTPIYWTYTAKHGEKDVPVAGNAPYNLITMTQLNENTFTEQTRKTNSLYSSIVCTVVSNDGRVMTASTYGKDSEGKEFTAILVFEKQ